MESKLYLVGTPIGNMGDITLRAIETLREVDYIACEDKRHSLPLLSKYDIKKPLLSYHQHSERESGEKIISLINEGKSVALITDAGMPCISDPGAVLVSMCRDAGVQITVVPGATAVASAMALSGITRRGFCFLGFLPEKNKDKTQLVSPYINVDIQLIFYCSPHNINEDIQFLFSVLGDRRIYIIKEITKIFESVTVSNLASAKVENPRGEFVLVIEGKEIECNYNSMTVEEHIKQYLEKGMDKKTAIKLTAKDRGVPKDEVYKIAMNLADEIR